MQSQKAWNSAARDTARDNNRYVNERIWGMDFILLAIKIIEIFCSRKTMKKFTFINDIQVVKDDLEKAEIRKY